MKIRTHQISDTKVAEVVATGVVVKTVETGLDLLGDLHYQDYDKITLHQKNITPDFFELTTGVAGEILQKFSNYRVRLTIIGDFSPYTGKRVSEFISESNRGKQANFVGSVAEALHRFSTN